MFFDNHKDCCGHLCCLVTGGFKRCNNYQYTKRKGDSNINNNHTKMSGCRPVGRCAKEKTKIGNFPDDFWSFAT